MGQLNIHMTPEFEKDLRKFMKIRHISTKAEAIRTAIKDELTRITTQVKKTNFSEWLGLGTHSSLNPNPRFKSDDDLWK